MAEEASTTIEITEFVPAREGRPHLLRGRLLPRPGQGRRAAYALLAAAMRADRPLRARQVGGARQAVPGADAPGRERPRHAGRSTTPTRCGRSTRCPIGDAAVKDAELKLAVQLVEQIATEEFHPENVRGRGAQALPGGHPAQGRGPGSHGRRARAAAAPRSSTSWRRSRPAWPKGGGAAQAPPSRRSPRRRSEAGQAHPARGQRTMRIDLRCATPDRAQFFKLESLILAQNERWRQA